jgi:hypothetical protein
MRPSPDAGVLGAVGGRLTGLFAAPGCRWIATHLMTRLGKKAVGSRMCWPHGQAVLSTSGRLPCWQRCRRPPSYSSGPWFGRRGTVARRAASSSDESTVTPRWSSSGQPTHAAGARAYPRSGNMFCRRHFVGTSVRHAKALPAAERTQRRVAPQQRRVDGP